MDERISIVTPDHIELDFELAGLGSRFLALIIDALLIGVIMIVVVGAAVVLGLGTITTFESARAGSWVLAIALFAYFVVMWGYFLFFEALNQGQTPGKRWTGIRVIRDNGLPVGWRESALRNLVRAADILPPPACLVGGLMIILSKTGKRLGDLLAGTMVVTRGAQIEPAQRASRWGAAWIVKVEKGKSRRGMMLGDVRVDAQQLQVIERFLARRDALPSAQRQTLAWRIASPFLSALGEDPVQLAKRSDRFEICEQVLKKIMALADSTPQALAETAAEDAADRKRREWREFRDRIEQFEHTGKSNLSQLPPDELAGVMEDYRKLACDLARARSMGRQSSVVRHLNGLTVQAHNVLYRRLIGENRTTNMPWAKRFPIAVRTHLMAVGVSALLLFGPAVVTFVAVQIHPELGYDLVPDAFFDFQPARQESLHNIPSIARPVVASSIVTNNIQVTFLAFGFGLTAGVGTAFLLVVNGIQLGAVAGWMTAKGNSSALWGWIMPHGGTELMAIVLAGGAGFALARALIAPGEMRRATALRHVALSALFIELGVMVMLVFAGVIEGFVSPSSIGFPARIAILVVSLLFWIGYLVLGGIRNKESLSVIKEG
jgi:uncharacterized membrane protein SpoIIM required for sporulation/uncharacterized RDD family membrane protein YckC